jgi:hypothetical protein
MKFPMLISLLVVFVGAAPNVLELVQIFLDAFPSRIDLLFEKKISVSEKVAQGFVFIEVGIQVDQFLSPTSIVFIQNLGNQKSAGLLEQVILEKFKVLESASYDPLGRFYGYFVVEFGFKGNVHNCELLFPILL